MRKEPKLKPTDHITKRANESKKVSIVIFVQ